MDILLSHGYFLGEDAVEQEVMKPYPPLGLLYLSSYLKRSGFSVEVFDSTFSSVDAFGDYVREMRPPVVGLSANLMTRPRVVEMIRLCHGLGSWVVVGGAEPANYARQYLAQGAHVVVEGEGERTLEELLRHRLEGRPETLAEIEGIAITDEAGGVLRTSSRPMLRDLDKLPLPDREAVDQQAYLDVWRRHHGRGSISIITSRGCPFTCSWCSHGVYGFSYRCRSPQNVADEVQALIRDYAPDMLWYADDVFTMNRRWLFSFSRELQRRRIRIPFETISREDRLDAEVIRELAVMGCFRLWIGAESGSQQVLDAMQRRTSASRVVRMVRLLQDNGIEAGLFIMLGYVGEKREDVEATLSLLKKASPDRFLTTVAYPIKGTAFFDELGDRIVNNGSWETGTDRDLGMQGRYPDRFYDHAGQWIHHRMKLHREWRRDRRDYLQLIRSCAGAGIGRLGMLVPWNQAQYPENDS